MRRLFCLTKCVTAQTRYNISFVRNYWDQETIWSVSFSCFCVPFFSYPTHKHSPTNIHRIPPKSDPENCDPCNLQSLVKIYDIFDNWEYLNLVHLFFVCVNVNAYQEADNRRDQGWSATWQMIENDWILHYTLPGDGFPTSICQIDSLSRAKKFFSLIFDTWVQKFRFSITPSPGMDFQPQFIKVIPSPEQNRFFSLIFDTWVQKFGFSILSSLSGKY